MNENVKEMSMNDFYVKYQKLIHQILHKDLHINTNDPKYEDCYQEGFIGLLESRNRFDESKGYKFTTFAYPTVLGKIKRYLREKSSVLKNRCLLDRYSLILKLQQKGYSKDKIINELKITEKQYEETFTFYLNYKSTRSLDEVIFKDNNKGDKEIYLYELIEDQNSEYNDMLDNVLYSDDGFEKCLINLIDKIKFRKSTYKSVFTDLVFDILYEGKTNQTKIANKYNLSQAQVSRIYKEYKSILKELMIEEGVF